MGSTSLTEVKAQGNAVQLQADQTIDMFSLRGFELAQRIAKAFATSDAVPAIFRSQVLKKSRDGDQWIENASALGNCLVAIETARAVGMGITAVMQNANVIEGRLTWSGKFIIAAINASNRFTPLRFQIRNLGLIKAKYREKLGWNKAKGGFDFEDRVVEVENLECIAWAFIRENGRTTAERVESAPVSMKMAVEEGWYGKSGSKWQTEMKHLMLQYRAGSFFGNIHAPDVVMGMGRTVEEVQDMTTIDMAPDGRINSVTTEELRRPANAGPVQVVQETNGNDADPETGEIPPPQQSTKAETVSKPAAKAEAAPTFDIDTFANKLATCEDLDALDVLADEIRSAPDQEAQDVLNDIYRRRRDELNEQPEQPAAKTAPAPVQARRGRTVQPLE